MMRPLLQLALDLLRLDEALKLARAAAPWVDILEAGTPLIKSVGIGSVERLRREFPDKPICADMKTADAGRIEARLAISAGADLVTVLGSAPRPTIASVVEETHRLSRKVIVDCLGIEPDLGLSELSPDYLEIHTGLDEQPLGRTPFDGIRRARGLGIPLCVAGGIDLRKLDSLAGFELSIIVVGGAITRAEDPGRTARLINHRIKELWG